MKQYNLVFLTVTVDGSIVEDFLEHIQDLVNIKFIGTDTLETISSKLKELMPELKHKSIDRWIELQGDVVKTNLKELLQLESDSDDDYWYMAFDFKEGKE